MKKITKMHYILCIAILALAACKKQPLVEPEQTKPGIETPVIPPTQPDPNPNPGTPSFSKTYEVGTGSGNLTIDGSTFTISGATLFKIKAGNYSTITVKNFVQDDANPVYVKNNGLVEITSGQSLFSNLRNVVFSGDGTPGIDKGFLFRDISYRAIKLDENAPINKFTIQYVSFRNIGNNVINLSKNDVYDGTSKSYAESLKFLHLDCDNTGGLLSVDGSISSGRPTGLVKNIEIAYVNFKNAPSVGTIVYMGNAENYDIHHNIVTNINTQTDIHNGIFMMKGNGRFHDNHVSNHQGNSIRAWGFSIGTVPKDILIYNNIIVNSRKYSGFEVQSFDDYIIPGVSTYTNAKVFNNTCGNLNLSRDWQGNVVDVYSLKGGTCDVYNNLAFNLLNSPSGPGNIAGQESGLTPTVSNNLYFNTSKEAGILDENTMKLSSTSPAKGKGKHEALSTVDFYGNVRANSPSIGAVE
ncbi:MAG: hypothetical protein P0Y49_08675 [Candidatus Pedobacter colombiensis]|uniref:Right-handed parallel beta-helix repeat-containing protein n=1 Tax=Candidatus Pedobacter colombiensis TaxID=3121371 RepID=A0AAJ6B8T2_9SPHI|nr:hypothetical protein [Pedobacter sp.]WEK21214.1 MAG: hypothetical protein P0Y49_08675 [Pedobacter sp.]